jgi:voltage-gated potassium channel Kch
MQSVGLSPALGTFLAGVVLADSEFRHELIGDIEPFKGLLLGLFFIAVGASVDFQLVQNSSFTIAGVVLTLVLVKALILGALARLFDMNREQGVLFALALAQGGEFCFVMLSYASTQGVLDNETSSLLVASVALSMASTPVLLLFFDRVLQPRLAFQAESAPREPDRVDEPSTAIIAGFGQFGSTVGRLLRANGIRPVVLENDGDRVDLLRRIGLEVYYGDASRLDLLRAAGADEAAVLVIAIGDGEKAVELVHIAREHFPQLRILARATERRDAFNLIEAGAGNVYRDTLDTSLRVGIDALRATGMRAHRAHRSALAFRRHDEKSFHELAAEGRIAPSQYLRRLRQKYRDLEQMMLADNQDGNTVIADAAWDAESLIREFGERKIISS